MDGSLLAVLPVIVFIFLFFFLMSKLFFFVMLAMLVIHFVLSWLFEPKTVEIIYICAGVLFGISLICTVFPAYFSSKDQGDDYGWKAPGPPED